MNEYNTFFVSRHFEKKFRIPFSVYIEKGMKLPVFLILQTPYI